uniref:Lipoprotein n=1 Tax=Candidatus Kentrum sp. TUN TaxID=2126343 RepID=A0A450ZHD0_9GAMM|nr:MAG: hypothetical protein BECKTUN1418F_GA0071002_101711 [Candidatus Kentron sp. TUN]VFK53976.1 MAG: hypothetical protein BECKTUN1418E_GA0071001_101911 [Candidatus Kentron sp. TUN]VFK56073.1 MAG: hypothetical protein BECKTUN1418D_GA0071000_10417 [Candidatus Kentron sp. TUN]
MKKRNFLIVIGALLLLSACTKSYVVGFDPQSHFEYPNSNIIPLGKVKGEASESFFLTPPIPSSRLQKAAIDNALEKKVGSDILINFVETYDITSVPFITTLTYRVEGTAAKMEIGSQKLH